MIDDTLFAWLALLLLGALHGINPGMGWLFAVALGMQERSGRAVWRSLVPLATGHALAVAVAVAILIVAGRSLPPHALRWGVAALLLCMGVLHLTRRLHPRWTGMRVSARELVMWSFLMASAHGAGVMALAFVPSSVVATDVSQTSHASLASSEGHAAHGLHTAHDEPAAAAAVHSHGLPARGGVLGMLATLIHTAGYLLATGLIATTVYYRFGLRLLQRAWINLDVVWAGALVVTAILIPLL